LSYGLRDPLKTEHILFAVRHDAAKIQKADRLIRFRKEQTAAKKADRSTTGIASANAANDLDALAATHGDE
jgi:ABC-type siderophore export system fused ATPase/permease subunit